MTNTRERRDIRITIDAGQATGALKNMASQMGALNRSVKGISNSFSSLRSITSAFTGATIFGFGIREIVDISDSMQLLSSRIAVLAGGTEQAGKIMTKLRDAANSTKTSIDGIASIYARLAASTKELNLSQSALLDLTTFLQNTYRLSGATTEEATNSVIQLTQAFSLGVLRGQDFKSVMSQNVVLADILANGLGKTRGGLQKMAEAGELTNAKVLPVLFKNMGDINSSADKLGQTFSQTLTVAMNDFKFAVSEVNKELEASDAFAKFVAKTGSSVKLLTQIYIELGRAVKDNLLPSFISFSDILSAAFRFLGFGPIIDIVKSLNSLADTVKSVEDLKESFESLTIKVKIFFLEIEAGATRGIIRLREFFGAEAGKSRSEFLRGLQSRIAALRDLQEKQIENTLTSRYLAKQNEDAERARTAEGLAAIKSEETFETRRDKLLKSLNRAYNAGKISIQEYYSQLNNLDRKIAENKFLEGKSDIEQFNSAIEKLNRANLNQYLTSGVITMEEFNAAIEQNKLDELNNDLQAGKISLLEYDAALIKVSNKFLPGSALRTGAEDYLKSIGTLSQGIASVVTGTFSKLEDALVEFTKSGKFNFNQFAQAVLDDLNRIIIRSLIIRPLAEGLLNFTPSSYAGASNSGVGAVRASAKGDIFDSLTPYMYGRGKLGVMGEKGPEAIMPLKRGSDGSLGVSAATAPVFVNITNQTGGEVTQKESTGPNGERVLDILIQNKMKEGIASGALDRTFSQSYGLKRRGT